MKKTKIFLSVILIILFFGSSIVYAESDIKDELLDEVIAEVESENVDFEQITKNVQDGSAFNFLGVVNSVLKLFAGEFKESMFLVIKLIALAVLAGVLCNLKTTEEGGATEVSFFACYASVAGLLINSFYELIALADSTVDTLKIFMQFVNTQKMLITPKVTAVMIAAAIHTPRKTQGNACFTFIFISAATRAPVHAPVPGRGIATNRRSPKGPYFSTVSLLR